MGETFDEVNANKERALSALKVAKELEKSTKMNGFRMNRSTIVFCKNKDKIKDYKKYNNGK